MAAGCRAAAWHRYGIAEHAIWTAAFRAMEAMQSISKCVYARAGAGKDDKAVVHGWLYLEWAVSLAAPERQTVDIPQDECRRGSIERA